MSVKVTPFGSAPVFMREGAGVPLEVTVKEPALPTRNDAAFALVMAAD